MTQGRSREVKCGRIKFFGRFLEALEFLGVPGWAPKSAFQHKKVGFDAFLGSTVNLPTLTLETGPKSGIILNEIQCFFHPFSRRIGASFSIEIDTFFEPFPKTFSVFLDKFVYV